MELWIRSQNKAALIKVEMLGVTGGIIHSYLGANKTTLGEYKTNERALEVLDEIQQKLSMKRLTIPAHNCNDTKHIYKDELTNYVYEMPKE